ncbi:TlpA family protein disulfide reductase [Hylemonella gracilis]|uniref:TlpA family protein disulfide reductase n=1 Tax=Hylemonella gracilis TaxID=80880 RepID=A0A4P6UM46_9BURK|nr:TlpA disulfide reductase family protein [Hylemonella gracilis]QBK06243.1 TlpA family protein disulfide reductase [Hylemonella gracilis]
MERRHFLYAGAALAAAGAGATWAWWRAQPQAMTAGVMAQFWGLTLDTPQGERLALGGLRGKPLLVNFWATWCPPCVEELPLLNAFYRQNSAKGWQIVGIAVDKLAPVQAFMQRLPLDFPVVLSGAEGLNLSQQLGNQARGLPFTVLVGADGVILNRKIGKLSEADLAKWQELG